MSVQSLKRTRVTAAALRQRKISRGQAPVAVLTAYDFSMAKTLDEAGIEVLLVGDSLAQTMLGHEDTLSLTVDEMLHHVKAVSRGATHALVVADLPFLSYGTTLEAGLTSAGRMIQEGSAQMVKLEGASPLVCQTIARLSELGIPVMGHLGLTPQAIHTIGGYKVQGKTPESAAKLLADALRLQEAGASSVVLEMVPAEVAEKITSALEIPTIGIGAGVGCDGQVLVIDDIVGRFTEFQPRFVRRYAQLAEVIADVAQHYALDVAQQAFPSVAESFALVEADKSDVLEAMEAVVSGVSGQPRFRLSEDLVEVSVCSA